MNIVTTPLQLCKYCLLWDHTPHGFVLPQVALGKRPLHIEGSPLLISTSPCTSLGDVGFHELQDPLLDHYNPPPLRAHASLRVGLTLLARAWF